jgi:DNA-binding response OmpR family regulator
MAKILVVDDELDILRIVTTLMETRGHRVATAIDGPTAISAVANDRPDLIILDVNLPKLNGFAVCQQLKSDAATRTIPIVMMTAAHVTVEDAERGTELGADEYVVKPFLREILVHNVERLLNGSNRAPG